MPLAVHFVKNILDIFQWFNFLTERDICLWTLIKDFWHDATAVKNSRQSIDVLTFIKQNNISTLFYIHVSNFRASVYIKICFIFFQFSTALLLYHWEKMWYNKSFMWDAVCFIIFSIIGINICNINNQPQLISLHVI